MATITCELCGATDFVKEDGAFVCQGCNTKYTLEEARKLMSADSPSSEGNVAEAVAAVASAVKAIVEGVLPEKVSSVNDFDTRPEFVAQADARAVNNYVCQGWQLVVDEYERIEHPTEQHQQQLVERAKECLMLLDRAAMSDPNEYVRNMLIYKNCMEIVESVKDSKYEVEQEDGTYKKQSLPFSTKIEVPGQKDSWSEKYAVPRKIITDAYIKAHPQDADRKLELQEKAAVLEEQIDELKDEKRSKGFFNFSEKREVKDRMKPVKAELSGIRDEIYEIDHAAERHADAQMDLLSSSYVILDF